MEASVVVATHDFAVRDVLDRFFTNRNYSVSFEQMGSKAILKLLEKPIDIFILDLDDDDNSTLDIIEVIRRTRPRLPIVVLSDSTSLDRVRRLSEAGVFYCAMKPVQIMEIEKVVEALERYRQNQRNGI